MWKFLSLTTPNNGDADSGLMQLGPVHGLMGRSTDCMLFSSSRWAWDDSDIQGVTKSSPPKTFWNIFTSV